jgi:DNA-directed RNA polymerase specialized sigma24 family protein
MIRGAIFKRLPRYLWNRDSADLIQSVKLHIATKSLPHFDTEKHSKPSTYLFVCIANVADTIVDRAISESQRHVRSRSILPTNTYLTGKDESPDRQIERLAADITAHPGRYLSPRQARAVAVKLANPGTDHRDLARIMGIVPTAFSMLMGRVYARIREIANEEIL